MAGTIKLSIKARGDSDAPTVDDLLNQVGDYFDILKGVEEAIAEDGKQSIDWRIISATTNSPITLEAAAFSKNFAVNGARSAANNAREILRPINKPYKEQGSVEGFARIIERDGYGRPLLWIKHRLTGENVKCLIVGDALAELETHQIRDVWRNRRIQVHGVLHYRSLGQLGQIDAINVEFLRERQDLPDINDIADETFTGGINSEGYLERLRDGNVS